MKLLAKSAAFIMSALVLFASCQKEQSSLTCEDFGQKAKVTGVVTYPASYEIGADNVVRLTSSPVDSATVIIKVTTSDLTNSTTRNEITLTAHTDSEGNYSVEVPTVDAGINVSVQAVSFNGTQKYLKEVKDGKPVWDEKTGEYSTYPAHFRIYPDQMITKDLLYSFTEKELAQDGTFEGTARIMGTLTYNAGQTWTAGEGFSELLLPAANTQMVLNVEGKEYVVLTDENGHYDITLPVKGNPEASLSPHSFMGTYKTLEDVQNGEYIFNEEDCIYSTSERHLILNKGGIYKLDFYYTNTSINSAAQLKYRLPLKVKVGMGLPSGITYYLDNYSRTWYNNENIGEYTYNVYKVNESPDYYEYTGKVNAAKGVDVIITVTYPEEYNYIVRNYGATTDENGMINIEIPALEEIWETNITVQAQSFVYTEPFWYYLPTNEYIEDSERRVVNEENKEIDLVRPLKVKSASIAAGNGVYEQEAGTDSQYVKWTEFKEFVPEVKLLMVYDLKNTAADTEGGYDYILQSELLLKYYEFYN